MGDSNNTAAGSFLRGLAWLLFVIGGLSFWMGGRAISEFAKVDRGLAEMEGIGLALACAGLGAVAKTFADRFDEDAEDPSAVRDADSNRNP